MNPTLLKALLALLPVLVSGAALLLARPRPMGPSMAPPAAASQGVAFRVCGPKGKAPKSRCASRIHVSITDI
jgi:hypothetical protein